MPNLHVWLAQGAVVLLCATNASAQWSPNHPLEEAPAREKIPPYVQHATYVANLAPLPGPIDVGYNYHLPPDYDTSDERYPVVYQLGGHTDNESIGLVDRGLPNRYQEKMLDGTIRPVINVYVNGPGTLESYTQLEATIIEELIPHIDAKFRTLPFPECRHIEGYSRGGSGAPLFAFRHPELFRATVSNAGSGTEGITEALPGLKVGAQAVGMRLLVTILEGDGLLIQNEQFRDFLDQEGIAYDFASAPGGAHDTNLYFNDPASYAAIGHGNVVWHERVFVEQGCGSAAPIAGQSGAGNPLGGAGAGDTPSDGFGAAGGPASGGTTAGVSGGGAGTPAGSGPSGAAGLSAKASRPIIGDSSCSIRTPPSARPGDSARPVVLAISLAVLLRKRRAVRVKAFIRALWRDTWRKL